MPDTQQIDTPSQQQIEVAERLGTIFMPYALRHRQVAIESEKRFVHYTSAECALKIINTRELWMRSTTCMSDYSEVLHGYEIFGRHPETANLIALLDEQFDGIGTEATETFNQSWPNTQLQTYIASVSEHEERENEHGRLAMWRAFGRSTTRVAIVFRLPMKPDSAQSLNLFFSPVGYFTNEELVAELSKLKNNVMQNANFLRDADRATVRSTIFLMLLMAIVCLKHEGFSEEREWRAIYLPTFHPSPLMRSDVEVVEGIPQIVYKIPFKGELAADLGGLELRNVIDRIIIGPSSYPWVMYEAFVTALKAAGMADADARVFNSDIPIRT